MGRYVRNACLTLQSIIDMIIAKYHAAVVEWLLFQQLFQYFTTTKWYTNSSMETTNEDTWLVVLVDCTMRGYVNIA